MFLSNSDYKQCAPNGARILATTFLTLRRFVLIAISSLPPREPRIRAEFPIELFYMVFQEQFRLP